MYRLRASRQGPESPAPRAADLSRRSAGRGRGGRALRRLVLRRVRPLARLPRHVERTRGAREPRARLCSDRQAVGAEASAAAAASGRGKAWGVALEWLCALWSSSNARRRGAGAGQHAGCSLRRRLCSCSAAGLPVARQQGRGGPPTTSGCWPPPASRDRACLPGHIVAHHQQPPAQQGPASAARSVERAGAARGPNTRCIIGPHGQPPAPVRALSPMRADAAAGG
jgi:hypothetical protein